MTPDSELYVRPGLVIPAGELHETASRSGGPGGQNVNKVNTRVTLRWSVAGSEVLDEPLRRRLLERLGPRVTRAGNVVVHASRHRSRARNRALARERLAELLSEALHTRRSRIATRAGRATRERAKVSKQRRSQLKRSRRRVRPADDS